MPQASARARIARLVLALLIGGMPLRPAFPQAASSPGPNAAATACRTGPNGEADAAGKPQMADRGIGGTGVTPASPASPSAAARATPPVLRADRGIGGTGIVGVVTGFASICLSGREVAFADDTPVVMDGTPATAATLRAGQVSAVEAAGEGASLQARRIAIRHEVSGPVEEVGAAGMLRVAGQRVRIGPQTWGRGPVAVGEWLAVSGLRASDGVIEATRIDRRAPGEVFVHGVLVRDGRQLRVGALEIRMRPGATAPVLVGASVTAVGRLANGILIADTLEADLLLADPVGYFGPAVSVFVVEGYATLAGGRLRLGPQFGLRAPESLAGFAASRAVAEFRRGGNGTLALTGLRQPVGPAGLGRDLLAPRGPAPRSIPQRLGGSAFGAPRFGGAGPNFGALHGAAPRFGGPRGGGGFEPAPVPNRGLGRPGVGQNFRNEGSGGGRRGAHELAPGGSGAGSGGGGFSGFGPGEGGGFRRR